MLHYYQKEYAKATKQLEFALCGFVGEIEGCIETINRASSSITDRIKALDEMQNALDAVQSIRYLIEHSRDRIAIEREKLRKSEEDTANEIRNESVAQLLNDSEEAEA